MSTRLRIISDGTPAGTQVLTEDGQRVRGVQLVQWHLSTDDFARCSLEVIGVAVDMVGDSSMVPSEFTVQLAEPQAPPKGPGFPVPDARLHLTPEEVVHTRPPIDVFPEEVWVCPRCGNQYDDGEMVCVGDDIHGEHQPEKVKGPSRVPKP